MNNIAELTATPEPIIDISGYGGSYGEIFYDSYFIEKLRIEKLRAHRSKSTLSIILLSLDKEIDDEVINMNGVLDVVRARTRAIDICGFVNHITIGILLPDTDEKGAKELCEKLVNGSIDPQFSATTSSYPDQIFESLTKIGSIQRDAFPFKLEEPSLALSCKLLLKSSKSKAYIDSKSKSPFSSLGVISLSTK